jgi:hypothetical protein
LLKQRTAAGATGQPIGAFLQSGKSGFPAKTLAPTSLVFPFLSVAYAMFFQ